MNKYSVIGKRLPRVDARDKVTGKALYTDDLSLPRMLCGAILRSPLPHAAIVGIDASRALKLPGVKAIVTAADTPQIKFGIISRSPKYMDEYPLAVERVRFIGEEVAAVAAVDMDVALEALDLIEVEYKELPAVFDLQQAQKPGAPQLHEHAPNNISREYHIKKGEPDKVFEQCDHIREDTFTTQSAIHGYLEPRAALASWHQSGKLTVYTSTQTPYYVQQHLGLTLDMNPDNIRVIKPFVGGGFGGKSDGLSAVEFCAALLAKHADRPVKLVCSRDEEFNAARRKHPTRITMKTGVKKDGTIVARKCRAVLDGGAYCSLGPLTTVLMGTYSSRVTVAAGNAALNAANLIKAQIFQLVSDELEANLDDLIAFDRKIAVNGSPDRFITFADAVNLHQKRNHGAPLVAQGSYNSPDPLSPTYSFGAYICEVEVSRLTGEVRIKKFTVGHDCGQPLNPMSVEGQIEGCIGMGIGYAISEQLIFEDGRTMNPSFLGYGIPTADQMPDIKISHVITDDPHGPFGAKETGEGSLDPAAPAIANAIYNATGVRIKDLPITAEKILKGLASRGR